MKRIILSTLITLLFSVAMFGQVKSIYTKTSEKDCTASKVPVEDGYIVICPEIGGYKLELLQPQCQLFRNRKLQ